MAQEWWDDCCQQILNKVDYDKKVYTVEGLCESAAIYGLDGAAWAWTKEFPEITAYTHTIEGMTAADSKKVEVDEFQNILKASLGDRQPSEAGIRIGGEKYMFVSHEDSTKCTQLSKKGGGFCMCRTNTGIVMATYIKDKPCAQKGNFQNAGDCAQ